MTYKQLEFDFIKTLTFGDSISYLLENMDALDKAFAQILLREETNEGS
jgi:hypothetical protein